MKALIMSELSSDVLDKMENDLQIHIVNKSNLPHGDVDALRESLLEVDPEIAVISAHPFGKDMFEIAQSLKLIVCTRGNPVNVDKVCAAEHSVILTNTPARNANAVTEFTFGLMISLMRNIHTAYVALKNGKFLLPADAEIDKDKDDVVWIHKELPVLPYRAFRGSELYGKTLGLIGLGAIGKGLGEKAKVFGMSVVAYDPFVDSEAMQKLGIQKLDLKTLLSESDVISLHAKVTDKTKHLISHKEFALMKNDAVLINTARGALIDHEALLKALNDKKLKGAALDVFEYEPLTIDNPLLKLPNLLFTPHIGGASKDVILHHSRMAYESIEDFVAPINLCDQINKIRNKVI